MTNPNPNLENIVLVLSKTHWQKSGEVFLNSIDELKRSANWNLEDIKTCNVRVAIVDDFEDNRNIDTIETKRLIGNLRLMANNELELQKDIPEEYIETVRAINHFSL